MAWFLIRWLAIFLAVLVAAWLLPGVHVVDNTGAAIFALALGLLNALVRPIIAFLSTPITCLTLGLFTLVVNGFMFWLATNIVPGVRVDSFLTAIIAAIIVSLANMALSALVQPRD